ncbi:hypothetical protein FAES_3657 [Fibrella aestuarina BUZ 2]|uniref:Uncharacterized protein n=1 Tax=Fibrella aestuarina BUZ 2 TaxID=1166018 RepID=I0KC11_9BACT|nr:hypothetical protein [Fibrella aestuarina]CCH01664.1 hypothetical protein FAES_3657 [Fibrella aestuarina BUZ 2]
MTRTTPIVETCRVCGCHDSMACMHEEYGPCAWDRENRTKEGPICTACSSKLTDVERPWLAPRWWVEWDRGGPRQAGENPRRFENSVRAVDEAQARQLITERFTFDQGREVFVRSVERVPNFIARTTPGLYLTWWEDVAVQRALDCLTEPDNRDLDTLAETLEDDYREAVDRDGESGPRAGTITYSLTHDVPGLIIRGKDKRTLMRITLEQIPQTATIGEPYNPIWRCDWCKQTFDPRDVGQQLTTQDPRLEKGFGMVCVTCSKDPDYIRDTNDFLNEEAIEQSRDEAQWRAYRNGWPIVDNPAEQSASNEKHSHED